MIQEVKQIKVDKWHAMMIEDENGVVIANRGLGGAVVGGKTYQEAEKKFIESMELAESINKLLYFKQYGKFPG